MADTGLDAQGTSRAATSGVPAGATGENGSHRGMGLGDTLRVAFGYWRPHLRLGLLLLVVLAVPQAFKAFFAYSQRLIVDRGLLGHDAALLFRVMAALAAGFVLATAAALLADYLGARIGAAILNQIRTRLFAKLQRLSMAYYGQARSGDVVARFTSDLADIQKSLTTRIVDAVVATLGLLINIPVAFTIDWRLSLLMLAGMPVAALGTRLFGARAASARYALKQEEAAVASTVQETVRAQQVVKVFGLGPWLSGRFDAQLDRLRQRFVRAEFLAELVGSTSSMGVLVTQVAVLITGAYLAYSGRLSTGSLIAFISLQAVVSKDAYDLAKKVIPSLIASSGGLQRIDELLREPEMVADAADAYELPRLEGPIQLERVSFSYSPERPILDRVDLRVEPGQRVALVGPSGSGKSTVLQLLLRFYDPEQGRITIGGHQLRSVTAASWRRQVAVVFQESFLFAGSIRDNIALGKLDASDAEIEAAARAAEIHDLIATLSGGYATEVGELGGRLSGGQKQRIAIARAILRDPAVLLLDEATSALDPATEAAINGTIERLAAGRMVVFVTHRLGAARSADQIVVLDQGRVVDSGTHQALLARDGLYRLLWEKQSGIQVSPDGRQARIDPERLAAIPLFAGLSESERRDLATRMTSWSCQPREVIVREGDLGDRFFVVARGKVAVVVGPAEAERRLAVLSDGDFFGEMALVSEAPRMASVIALQPTALLALSREEFARLLDDHPHVRAAIALAIARRTSSVSQ